MTDNSDAVKAAEEKYPLLHMTRTQDYHVEKLREAYVAGAEWKHSELEEENKRLKELIEKIYWAYGNEGLNVAQIGELWSLFKRENNL